MVFVIRTHPHISYLFVAIRQQEGLATLKAAQVGDTVFATEVRTFAILCSKLRFFKKSVLRLVRVECFHISQK